jgi:hypothetical protein
MLLPSWLEILQPIQLSMWWEPSRWKPSGFSKIKVVSTQAMNRLKFGRELCHMSQAGNVRSIQYSWRSLKSMKVECCICMACFHLLILTCQIAVEGCCHGSLNATYSRIRDLEKRNGYQVDLLIIGGDFQAIRNHADMECMSVPQKYRLLGEFYKCERSPSPQAVLLINDNPDTITEKFRLPFSH